MFCNRESYNLEDNGIYQVCSFLVSDSFVYKVQENRSHDGYTNNLLRRIWDTTELSVVEVRSIKYAVEMSQMNSDNLHEPENK